jgi:hypothetical protein
MLAPLLFKIHIRMLPSVILNIFYFLIVVKIILLYAPFYVYSCLSDYLFRLLLLLLLLLLNLKSPTTRHGSRWWRGGLAPTHSCPRH